MTRFDESPEAGQRSGPRWAATCGANRSVEIPRVAGGGVRPHPASLAV